MVVNTIDAKREHKWPQEIIDLVIRCKKCKRPMFLVFDPKVRDTCTDCGGHSKYHPPKKETN